MGNPTRCPKCNRFGTKELDGYCRACYANKNKSESVFYNSILKYLNLSENVVMGALAEVGCDMPKDVKPHDRSRVINIIKRRLPTNRKGHIVKEHHQMEDYPRMIREDPSKYAVEKETVGVEQ